MADEPRDCATILTHAATAVGPLLRSRVHALPPQVRHAAGLHFGWWTDDGTVLDHPGVHKSVRPALVLLCCRAVGGDADAARAAAVAVELVHNASLLHDDIIDRDLLRRGRPALWAAKGVPAAILAGDALFFSAIQTLADAPGAGRAVPVLLSAVQALIEGEYLDTLMKTGSDVSEDRAPNRAWYEDPFRHPSLRLPEYVRRQNAILDGVDLPGCPACGDERPLVSNSTGHGWVELCRGCAWVLAPCPCGQRHRFVPETPFNWNEIWQRAHMGNDGRPNSLWPAG